jgi:hypothetical protein
VKAHKLFEKVFSIKFLCFLLSPEIFIEAHSVVGNLTNMSYSFLWVNIMKALLSMMSFL